MSAAVETPPEPASEVALDRVMLAMDVVDTLRHQRALVEAELDGDRRQREFVARVQAIYESQGIEVPESVSRFWDTSTSQSKGVKTFGASCWTVKWK